jgi:hypothetical protein
LQPVTAPLRQHDLASIAANLRDGAIDAGEAAWLSDALSKIADGEPADIALGLRQQRAEMLAATKARDCILRDAAKTMPGLPLTEAANRIHNAMLRYRESAWRRERQLDACPDAIAVPFAKWRGGRFERGMQCRLRVRSGAFSLVPDVG